MARRIESTFHSILNIIEYFSVNLYATDKEYFYFFLRENSIKKLLLTKCTAAKMFIRKFLFFIHVVREKCIILIRKWMHSIVRKTN